MPRPRIGNLGGYRPLRLLVALGWIGAALLRGEAGRQAAAAEVSPRPTVHAAILPTSAIQVPLRCIADETLVWRKDQDQRMLLNGHVAIAVGYRILRADNAAIWLTPSSEAGENTYDVAIYLSGNVEVREGEQVGATRTMGTELLVTTRVAQAIRLFGPTPISKAQEDSPLVKRGEELRLEVLNRPPTPLYLPTIVITTAEAALQAGWIAKGPNNRIIPGPGDWQLVRDAEGKVIPGGGAQASTRPARPRPDALLVVDIIKYERIDEEDVLVLENAHVFLDSHDGKPRVEFSAQRMVAFTPGEPATKPAATTRGGGAAATRAAAPKPAGAAPDISKAVTGLYLEGDVEVDQGDQLKVRATQVYYDFLSNRAIMLDATLSTIDEARNVPLYLRADEIRQLKRGEFAAKKVTFSTSEFHTPHYHIGASEIYLQDATPSTVFGGGGGGDGSDFGLGIGGGGGGEKKTYVYQAKDATLNIRGVPVFFWPTLAGNTNTSEFPLRTVRVGGSSTYGLSIASDWSLLGLLGQPESPGLRADLHLDYFGKRGPATGLDGAWLGDDYQGLLKSYIIQDHGEDHLGRDRVEQAPTQETRDRLLVRHQQEFPQGITLQLEGAYVSDPTFLEQYFHRDFSTDKEQETSIYLKKQGDTDALSLLGKFTLFDFTAVADQIDDQFSTQKEPELKYWRIGDSFFDLFTYYSETGLANLNVNITNFTPNQTALNGSFLAPPAAVVPLDQTFKSYYQQQGWTTNDVLRLDTRQEIDMPLQIGDLKVTPYIAGRITWWDESFPGPPVASGGGSTTRVWGGAGIRSAMQFWHVYNDAESLFFDVHRLRHVIEPQFNLFVGGTTEERKNLQPFERAVEGISGSSGMQLSINQKWQTKRGGEGHWRNVDWITLNIQWNQFWNKDQVGTFFPQSAVRGFYFATRPELSLVQDSINVDGVWRVGERYRILGEADYGIKANQLEQMALGLAVDQTANLSYFVGARYIQPLDTDQITVAVNYILSPKYELLAAESYDVQTENNILSSLTIIRRMPRFNAALTITYNANTADTSVVISAWPEGFPDIGFGNRGTATSRY